MQSLGRVFTVLSLGLCLIVCIRCYDVEKTCTSRYDFESKLLMTSVKLEFEMSVLKKQYQKDVELLNRKTNSAMERLKSLSDQLENAEQSMIDVKSPVTTASPVVFSAKDVNPKEADKGVVFVFPDILTNIGDGYNKGTGFFTAPVKGTYMFAVQLCIQSKIYVHVEMYTDDVKINNAMLQTDSDVPCYTLNTLVYLKQGSRVCVKRGSTGGSDILYHDNKNRWSMFMGALIFGD